MTQAIAREAREEVGAVLGEVRLLGVYSNYREGKSDHVAILICDRFSLTGETDGEIERYGFFDLGNLPSDVSPGTRRRLAEYGEGQAPYVGRW